MKNLNSFTLRPSFSNGKTIFIVLSILIFQFNLKSQTGTLELPDLGTGLAGVNYNLAYHPFTDAIKTIRWIDVATWDDNGFPASANNGSIVRGRIGVSNGENLDNGQYILTWEGNGDVTFYNSDFTMIEEDLSSNTKRRVFEVTTDINGIGVQINSFPATNIKLWIPGEEDAPSIWNPDYLCYIDAFSDGVLRFMDLGQTNSSPQVDWLDRTPKNWSTYVNRNNRSSAYRIKGGVAYEAMIELANEMNSDLWICIPHLANDNYISNLAHLIKTGTDLATGEQTTLPLNPNLSVWLEYSNEVWNFNFSQSNWVNNNIEGDNLDHKYALKSSEVFTLFLDEFQDNERVIRVIGTQTVNSSRARKRMNALDQSEYDVLAITTYFQFKYENYIYNNWEDGALQHEDFYNYILNLLGSGPFMDREDYYGGTGENYTLAAAIDVPVVTYEGNEHLNMSRKVDTNNDGMNDTELHLASPGSLDWMHEFARSDYMYDLLERIQLRHEASGLRTFVPFVAVRSWSQNGQWGFAEYPGQPIDEATKYRWLHDHFDRNYPVCDTSVENLEQEQSLNDLLFYPNPFIDKLTFFSSHLDKISQVAIFSLEGKIIKNYHLDGDQIDLSKLPKGLYFMKVKSTHKNKTYRLIKI